MAKKKTTGTDSTAAPMPSSVPRRRAPAKRSAPEAAAQAYDAVSTASLETGASGNGHSAESPSYDEIAEEAYRRYLRRGGEHGRDFDDWLEAERELRSRR